MFLLPVKIDDQSVREEDGRVGQEPEEHHQEPGVAQARLAAVQVVHRARHQVALHITHIRDPLNPFKYPCQSYSISATYAVILQKLSQKRL